MFLEEELSYRVRGIFIDVSRRYGPLHKECVYERACCEGLLSAGISFVAQPRVCVHSLDTGSVLATYVPDLIVAGLVMVELKAVPVLHASALMQLEQYLRATEYEVGFLVNFGKPKAEIFRRIYTNDRKQWCKSEETKQ
ncbi:MAG: GxxExxY protein [Candidatus Uhrbacteria bacterium]